jgi:hypothetical protein
VLKLHYRGYSSISGLELSRPWFCLCLLATNPIRNLYQPIYFTKRGLTRMRERVAWKTKMRVENFLILRVKALKRSLGENFRLLGLVRLPLVRLG